MPDLLTSIPESPHREVAIEVRDVSKTFRIPAQRVETLKERVVSRRSHQPSKELKALDEISFEVARGECLGIVGRNGSGKSTLMKLLASIYRVDSGSIRIAGRLVPFIELGVGFNPELSAHENVILNGVMMGLTPREARRRLDEVVDFAELGEFADLKLKNYSSGMLVRLGFSLMTQVDADVLLVDEVLAVGDASFQQKCFDVFSELHDQGRTIVLITHDMNAVEHHCDRAMLLERGRIVEEGDPGDVTRHYLAVNFEHQQSVGRPEDVIPRERTHAIFRNVTVNGAPAGEAASLEQGDEIEIEIESEILRELDGYVIGFHIVRDDNYVVFAQTGGPEGGRMHAGEIIRLSARVANPLATGHYFIHVGIGNERTGQFAAFRKNAADFVVFGTNLFGGMVKLDCELEVEQVEEAPIR